MSPIVCWDYSTAQPYCYSIKKRKKKKPEVTKIKTMRMSVTFPNKTLFTKPVGGQDLPPGWSLLTPALEVNSH